VAVAISENYLSRAWSLGQRAGRELIYDIFEATDEADAKTILAATAPAAYQGLAIEELSAEPVDYQMWRGYARYSRVEDASEYTFTTRGGTQKLTQSLGTVGAYAPSGMTAPNFKGAIGVSEDKVEGVEVTSPTFQFSESHRITDAVMASGYKLTVFGLTGKVNNASFKGFAAGEVLFLGADGTKRGDEDWQITYSFACSPNAVNLNVGGNTSGYYGGSGGSITITSKLGWDYLWVRYADFEDATAFSLVKQPIAAYVERVYQFGDFSTLLIGTT